jgi:hypothetical protein
MEAASTRLRLQHRRAAQGQYCCHWLLQSDALSAARTALKQAIDTMTKDPEHLKVAESVLDRHP